MSRGIRKHLLLSPFYLWLVIALMGPIGAMFVMSVATRGSLGQVEPDFQLQNFITLFDPLYAQVLIRTLGFACANAILTVGVSLPVAFFLTRLNPHWRLWILSLVMVPFWTSFLIRVLAYMNLLRAQPFGVDLLYTNAGVLGAMLYNYLPFALLPLYASMEGIRNEILEAAKDLGAGRWHTLTRIIIPMSSGGIRNALLFVFIPSLGDYLIPELVGGGSVFLLGSFLHNQFHTARNWPLGAAAIVLLILISVIAILWLYREKDHDPPNEVQK